MRDLDLRGALWFYPQIPVGLLRNSHEDELLSRRDINVF